MAMYRSSSASSRARASTSCCRHCSSPRRRRWEDTASSPAALRTMAGGLPGWLSAGRLLPAPPPPLEPTMVRDAGVGGGGAVPHPRDVVLGPLLDEADPLQDVGDVVDPPLLDLELPRGRVEVQRALGAGNGRGRQRGGGGAGGRGGRPSRGAEVLPVLQRPVGRGALEEVHELLGEEAQGGVVAGAGGEEAGREGGRGRRAQGGGGRRRRRRGRARGE